MMDQHKAVFIAEANDLLIELEQSLLNLEEDKQNYDIINQVFRALHTIKGSGAMFGYENISRFTHNIETVFDLIRNGEVDVNKEIINSTLLARDQINLMLNNPEKVDEEIIKIILRNFEAFIKNTETKTELKKSSHSNEQTFHIYFKPNPEIFLTGTNPLNLISELNDLGSAAIIANKDDIPSLENLNTELCYISWDILLTTEKSEDDIKDVFIFVDDSSTIKITKIDSENPIKGNELYTELNRLKINSDNIGINANLNPREEEKYKQKENNEDKTINDSKLASLRVSADKLDNLVNLVSELVIVQARLSQTSLKINSVELTTISEEVERLTWELRDSALNIRMLQIGSTFSRFKRLVRDLSSDLGKEVELTTSGADTELDKTVIEKLNDTLIHIIRNSIDHGIEFPQERLAKGKDVVGTVHLSAEQSGGYVLIRITDDGAGINKNQIRKKAIEKGLISEDAELKDSDIYNLMFEPGFSTADKVTNVSGRGVGMDVVKQAIEDLRGSIIVESTSDKGSTITLKLPLTLAIIDGLLVKISDDLFVLPLSTVEECIELTKLDIAKRNGRHLVDIRGEIVPYISLRDIFEVTGELPEISQVVIVDVKGERIGFMVDNVIGQHQTVLKTLGKAFKNTFGVSGATILGDGNVALVIDVSELAAKEKELEIVG